MASQYWVIENEGQKLGPLTNHALALWGIQGLVYPRDILFRNNNRILAGRLQSLQPFIRNNGHLQRAKLWAIGGGKGGVGKSFCSAALGMALAAKGIKTVIVDLDFFGPNQREIFKLSYKYPSFWKAVTTNTPLAKAARATAFKNLWIIPGSTTLEQSRHVSIYNKVKLVQALRNLNVDVVLLDMGPETESDTLDYFITADNNILVTQDDPTALQSTVSFARSVFKRKIDTAVKSLTRNEDEVGLDLNKKQPLLRTTITYLEAKGLPADNMIQRALTSMNMTMVLNRMSKSEHLHPGRLLSKYFKDMMAIDIPVVGVIKEDNGVKEAMKTQNIARLINPVTAAFDDITAIAEKLHKKSQIIPVDLSTVTRLDNKKDIKNTHICGQWCPAWDDCNFQHAGEICPVRNMN
jgi:flagellar biosynthesis protein FlhG